MTEFNISVLNLKCVFYSLFNILGPNIPKITFQVIKAIMHLTSVAYQSVCVGGGALELKPSHPQEILDVRLFIAL